MSLDDDKFARLINILTVLRHLKTAHDQSGGKKKKQKSKVPVPVVGTYNHRRTNVETAMLTARV